MNDAMLFGPDTLRDPYPLYRRLRETAPVFRVEVMGGWLLTRHDDVSSVLRNPKFSVHSNRILTEQHLSDEIRAGMGEGILGMLCLDPPAHTRLRGLVNKAFTPRTVDALRGRIEALTDRLLDRVAGRNEMDLIEALAYPLPVMVIAELLGVPTEDSEKLRHWSDSITILVNTAAERSPEQMKAAYASRQEFIEYIAGVVAHRRARPGSDLISGLIAAREAGDRLTESEMLANVLLLLAAGHETTTNLIGNGVLALLRHPEQWAKLRDDASLIPNAVEEVLRYDSPVQITTRLATEDTVVGGATVRAGEMAWCLLGAANRDPDHFPDPDRLDVTRKRVSHLSFGVGIHFCLGAPLARLEGEIAFAALLRRFPTLRLATDDLRWRDNFTLRGVEALPVAWDR